MGDFKEVLIIPTSMIFSAKIIAAAYTPILFLEAQEIKMPKADLVAKTL